jgi:hypothetical protein
MPDMGCSISGHYSAPLAWGLLLSWMGGCIAGDGFLPRTDGRGGGGVAVRRFMASRRPGFVGRGSSGWSPTNTGPTLLAGSG